MHADDPDRRRRAAARGEYRHDQMDLRTELSEAQKIVEPRNGDSHLTFIGSRMRNCVTQRTDPKSPVYFIELVFTEKAEVAALANT